MAIFQSSAAKGIEPIPFPGSAGEVVAKRFSITVTAAMLAAGNIFELAPLFGGLVPRDFILDADDLDSGGSPALALDVGLMSGTFGDQNQSRTCDDVIFDGSTVAQAGGVARPTLKTAFRIGQSVQHRSIGVKVATAPATAQGGVIGLTVFYVAG